MIIAALWIAVTAFGKALADLIEEGKIRPSKQETANNKYKNQDPKQGPKFIGSTTLFVMFTDTWHFLNFVRHLSMVIAVISYTTYWNPLLDGLVLFGVHMFVNGGVRKLVQYVGK